MASDFYQKTLALYEEFRQRELQYLRTERSFPQETEPHNNARNIPLEQYLHRIRVREEEMEKTYSDTMKIFEDLDKQVDMMALKIEKLEVLQKSLNAANVHDIQTQHSSNSIGSNLSFYFAPNTVAEQYNAKLAYECQTDELHSKSTQANSVLCSQCKSQITLQNLDDGENKIMTPYMTDKESELLSPNEELHLNISKETCIAKTETTAEKDILERIKIAALSEETQSKSIALNDYDKSVNLNEAQNNDFSIAELLLNKNSNDLCEKQHEELTLNNSDQSNTPADVSRSKSDDESMNHEFDFLESDHKGPSLKKFSESFPVNASTSKTTARVLEQRDSHELFPETLPETVHETSSEIPLPMPRKKSNAYTCDGDTTMKSKPTKSTIVDNEAASSKVVDVKRTKEKGLNKESLTEAVNLQKDLSITDTEESSSEKNVPLTSTAAYQALLGKAPISQRVQQVKDSSESDTADEMENALYTAIKKRQSIIPEKQETQKIEENKKAAAPASAPIETKEFSRRPSSAVIGKPQSKLSRKTRKVLGLDTSSGSEVEPEVAPQKIATEDSDEFDFYD